MHLLTLHRRSFVHHWRANVAAVLGVAAGTAALTGALLVGDSMRGSLRQAALDRLGSVDYAVRSPSFFREALADDIAAAPDFERTFTQVCPAILDRGSVTHAGTRAAVHGVSIVGVDGRFWKLGPAEHAPPLAEAGRRVVLNQPLADELRAHPGEDVLLRVGKPGAISPETLLGRRDDTTITLRLTVDRIVPAKDLGTFALSPRQALPRNAYVPLVTLQRALDRRGRVNTLLVAGRPDTSALHDGKVRLQTLLRHSATLADLGQKLRVSQEHDYVALESEALLLAPPVERAACAAAEAIGCHATGVLSYLANTIAVETRPEKGIPYSTVAALDPAPELSHSMTLAEGGPGPALVSGEILLNEWAARDLGARPGDPIRLSYYVTSPFGRLDTQHATFRLRGVLRLEGGAADRGFTPEYPGVTDTESLADWDPPFPIDLGRIRDQDEAYWRQYRATPKAFVSLTDGQRLWVDRHERFGKLTSLRIHCPPGESIAETRAAFEREFLQRLDIVRLGLRVDPVRARALTASRGTTDFGGLFIGFSFFLIVSAAMLVALLFRLGVERRAHEVGLLLAIGFSARAVGRLLLIEGVLVAALGAGVGLVAAAGYAWLMLAGLRSWWSDAVNTPFLQLHATPSSYLVGYGVSVVIGVISIIWSLRGITRTPPRALLAGVVRRGDAGPPIGGPANVRGTAIHDQTVAPASGRRPHRLRAGATSRNVALLAAGLSGVLIVLSLGTGVIPPTSAFFGGGTGLLIACLAGFTYWLQIDPRTAPRFTGPAALLRLGLRNARRHVGRSLLTAGLIASATFVITALQAMRLDVTGDVQARSSGTGGFSLLAGSDVPLPYDLNTAGGRAALNLSDAAQHALAGVTCVPFRLRGGDETSCLSLYRPTEPRLLGAPAAMIDRGGFTFSASLAESESERRNPWTLLRRTLPDGVVPAIGDEAAALWQLHLDLGDELSLTDQRGREVRLRLVGLLRGSVLQGELIIAESRFTRLFPLLAGYSFYLIDAPGDRAPQVEQTLERELTQYGFAVTPAAGRLADLFAVQNTYLTTFQTLGGLGLLLGTVGLAAVMLRSVWERRSELALLRTLGFSRVALGLTVLIENALLVVVGLLAGLVSAAVVIAPHVASRATPIPWASLLLMFGAILAAGLLAGALALLPALRAPLLPALRLE